MNQDQKTVVDANPVPLEIIHQCTSLSPRLVSASSGDSINRDAAHTRVIIKFSDGSQHVIFVGADFSEEEYRKRVEGRKRY